MLGREAIVVLLVGRTGRVIALVNVLAWALTIAVLWLWFDFDSLLDLWRG